jgi:hypothetical protein
MTFGRAVRFGQECVAARLNALDVEPRRADRYFHAMRTLLRTSLFASYTILVAAVAGCSKDSGNDETTTSPGGGNNNQPAYNIAPDTALAVQTRHRRLDPAGRREGHAGRRAVSQHHADLVRALLETAS